MSDAGLPPPGARVRVTGPPRQVAARNRSRIGDVHEQTPLGDVYLRSLLREQLRLALGVLAVIGVTLGGLPVLFLLAPEVAELELLGLPLPWVLLGGLAYPFLLVVGWQYVHRVERNERDFADLVEGE